MANIVSIVNMKGGVGKTTLSIALADYVGAVLKKPVCLVDIDAQSNASFAMAGEERFEDIVASQMTIDHFFLERGRPFPASGLHDYVVEHASRLTDGGENISLIASSPRLRLAEREILLKLARINYFDQELEGRAGAAFRAGLQKLTARGTYVIVDSAPGISGFAMAALKASDLIIAPVNPDHLSAIGLELLGREIMPTLRRDRPARLLACRTKVRTALRQPRLARFGQAEFQRQVGFGLMDTIVPLTADLGRIVDEGDFFQSFGQKYRSAAQHAVAFGGEVMDALERRQ